MVIKYLVEAIKQPNKISCWAAAFLMLKRYAVSKTGLPTLNSSIDGPLERMIGLSSTKESRVNVLPISWQQVDSWCNRLGYHWKYIGQEPVFVEKALSTYGPLVYIAKLPGTEWQHALVLTGMYSHPTDVYRIMYNDPDGGKRREKSFIDFITTYPPLFVKHSTMCIIYAPYPYVPRS